MRVEILSDYGGDQLHRTERQLHAAGQDLHARQGSYRLAWDDLQDARRGKPLWRRIFGVSTPAERDALARTPITTSGASTAARNKAAGTWGEQALTQALSVLPDDLGGLSAATATAMARPSMCVLVGPAGVWAVEIKRRRIRINAVADQWWFEKRARSPILPATWPRGSPATAIASRSALRSW